MSQIKALDKYAAVPSGRREILGCALAGSLGIIIIDLLTLRNGVYYSDNILVLYPVAVHSLTESFKVDVRPLEYLIILAANNIYLPLWLAVSLLCTVGATILAALACERMFERQLPEPGWWVLGVANPLLFYLVSQPIVSQALCNLFFAGAMFAFVSELDRRSDQPARGWRADRVAVFLNLLAAALFFTKETAVAAAWVIPATTILIHIKRRRPSPLFVFSLLFPIAAGTCWILLKIWEKLKFSYSMVPTVGGGRYDLKLNPILWVENFMTTLSFPITPLPSSFIGFELLRSLWIAVALGSVILFILFIALLLRESPRRTKVALPLLVIAASCAPMILVRSSELYSSMIAPFAVSIVLLYGLSKSRWLSLAYGLILYVASLGNGIIFWLGPNFNLLGLGHLQYSIYSEEYQVDPICPIGTTAHVAWDETPVNDLPEVKNRVICVR
jgi:hypothetical protein